MCFKRKFDTPLKSFEELIASAKDPQTVFALVMFDTRLRTLKEISKKNNIASDSSSTLTSSNLSQNGNFTHHIYYSDK